MSGLLASMASGGVLAAPRKNYIALEMIEFQDSTFGEDLEKIISQLHEKIKAKAFDKKSDIAKSDLVQQLQKLTFNRLGIKVKIITDSMIAAVLPFYSNRNHIFIHDLFRGYVSISDQNKILKDANDRSGTVDTQKAKVTGLFSEYETPVYMNFTDLVETCKMSVPEIVAVYLHELGHAFYVCEYSDRLESNNQILANLAKDIFSKKEKKDVKYVFRELTKVNPKITAEEVDKLVNGDRVIAGVTWFKVVMGSVEEQLRHTKYDETAFEQLADNFAARFGYGRPLVIALDKMHNTFGSAEKSKALANFFGIITTIRFAFPLIFLGMGLITSIPAAIFIVLTSMVVLRLSAEDMKDYTYDDLITRYKRVRQQLVEVLKDSSIPKKQVSDILDDLSVIDRSIQESNKTWSLVNIMATFVFSNARKADNSTKEQKLLEELAFNDLFVKSAELRANA